MAREAYVPKFGNFDPDGQVEYSMVFEKARAGCKIATAPDKMIVDPCDLSENAKLSGMKPNNVPKFGSFDSDDQVQYTMVFDTARADHKVAAGAKLSGMKPNNVPKFGSFDSDDQVQYTMVFDTARADHKVAAGADKKINYPNDPSENLVSFGMKSNEVLESSTGKKIMNPNDPFESPEIFGMRTNKGTNFQRPPTQQQQGPSKIGRAQHSSNPDKKIVNPNDPSENSKLSGMKPNHVPNFGSFDSDDQVQYTMVFDTARADHKVATGADKKINNPNDLSENLASYGMKSNEVLASSAGKKIINPNDPFESLEIFGSRTNEDTKFQRPPTQQQQGPTKIGRVQYSSNPDKKIVNPNDSFKNPKLSGMKSNNVPMFGNFDSDDQVQYTMVFDTARADHKAGTGADKKMDNPDDPSEVLAFSTGKKMINPNDPFESPEIFGSKTNEDTNFQRSPTRQQQGLTKIGRVPHSSNPDKKIVNPNDSSENSKLSGMNPNSVPKFGNFNSDDQVQYTLVFDTARADHKAATGADKTINNPNDPSKNLASFGMKSNELLASSTGKKIKNPNDPFESPELFGMKTNEGTNFQRPPIQQQQGPTKIGRVQHSSNPQGGKQTNGELATSIGSPNHPSAPEVRLGNRTPAHASYLGLDRKEQNQAVPPLPASLPTAGRPGLRENMVPDWNTNDPSSGDGYTIIFSNAQSQKKGGPPPVPAYQSVSICKDDHSEYKSQRPPHERRCSWACCFGV